MSIMEIKRKSAEGLTNTFKKTKSPNVRWLLVLYDAIILALVDILLLYFYKGVGLLEQKGLAIHCVISFFTIFLFRFIWKIYSQIWRYGGIQCYIRLLASDICAFGLYTLINILFPIHRIAFVEVLSIICLNCLAALSIRMLYRYAYKTGQMNMLLTIFSGGKVKSNSKPGGQKIIIAIVGAGSIGVNLARELMNNPNSAYYPRCFIETNVIKSGRQIQGLPVISEDDNVLAVLAKYDIQEVVISITQSSVEHKKKLYDFYSTAGYKVKVYDYPIMNIPGKKRELRPFDIEELLFRKPIVVTDEHTSTYYKDKVVMITGGGGSIGSELCRQLAKMSPKQLIILDVYENGAYDVQQELKIKYGKQLDVRIVIVSVCNRVGLERAFKKYHPQIVINAAAHKHVPLMEDDCIEAVENNVFGTLNTVELAEQYGAERFLMVSTDKAVNPTNVMGATKRMCEMIVLNHQGNMVCSATRFGNVLGSAGSVIPLFKKQILAGGPVTITDKRIIRYFMTIPEASQLVLQSGSMAKNRELFVLDMGEPVKILDLAENMIRLSGQSDIEIVETGLRPGEKLFEELLVKTEKMDKTANELIFIERDRTIDQISLLRKIETLRTAVKSGKDEEVKLALATVVPTYVEPSEASLPQNPVKERECAYV